MFNLAFIIKAILGIGLICFVVWGGIHTLDHSILFETLSHIKAANMILASLSIIGVQAISTSRFAFINKKFGGDESWLSLHRMNMLSVLYSQIALPLIAQIVGRISHGSKKRRSYYAPMTVLEKSIAFIIMIVFGGVSCYILLNQNIIPEGLETALALIIGAIILVLSASLLFIFNMKERHTFLKAILKLSNLGVFNIALYSIFIQLGILLIYTVLGHQFVPEVSIISLVGGFSIVILATSVPIGFGGWGVREFAAAFVFIALGLPPEIGMIIGILYGLLNLVILVVTVLILNSKRTGEKSTLSKSYNYFESVDFWPVTTLLIMALLPFQIRLPLAAGLITFNSVDVIALIAMINVITGEWFSGRIKNFWSDQLMWPGIFAIGSMIVLGWVVGWLRFGSNEWATANRLTGLLMIYAYLFAGAAMRLYITPSMMAKFSLVLVFSLTASVVIKILAHNIIGYQAALFFNWSKIVSGFIGDRNAFCFTVGMAAVFVIYHTRSNLINSSQRDAIAILLTTLSVFILYSGSRSGTGAAIVILLWIFIAMPRKIPLVLSVAIGVLVFIQCVNIFGQTGSMSFHAGRDITEMLTVDSDRASTFKSGLNLFLDHPIFGSGLGAGIRDTGLVIHNLYLWILGEMGLFGAVLCLPITVVFIRTFVKIFAENKYPLKDYGQLHALFIFMVIFGGFSLVQDIAYQRILWLLIGFMIAKPRPDDHINIVTHEKISTI